MDRNKKANRPKCPKCGATMTKRTNKTTHVEFWGCTQFPKCKGSIDIYETHKSKRKIPVSSRYSSNWPESNNGFYRSHNSLLESGDF